MEFWNEMDYLDANVWILDPECPTPSDTRRRILIDPSCFLQITVDPMKPRTLPAYLFLGNEKHCLAYQNRFEKNLFQW
jgi:E3 ubiquitin-protein ligase FANCL